MTRRIRSAIRIVAATSVVALGAIAAPAVSAGDPCFHGYEMPPASTGAGPDIKLMPCSFAPTVTTVAVGAEVAFVNGPDYTHLITGANQTWGSRDVEVQPGETVSYTFDEPGVYPYACALHVGMSGAIVVGDPDEALAAGTSDGSAVGGSTTGAADASTAGEAQSAANEPDPGVADDATVVAAQAPNIAFVVGGIVAGLVAGAAAVWLAVRRRRAPQQRLLHAE